jgi:hypothetical protein
MPLHEGRERRLVSPGYERSQELGVWRVGTRRAADKPANVPQQAAELTLGHCR